jgi:hypothetical protein
MRIGDKRFAPLWTQPRKIRREACFLFRESGKAHLPDDRHFRCGQVAGAATRGFFMPGN